MPKQFRKREDEEELIRRFEAALKNKRAEFFDLEAFEAIIDYYLEKNKNRKALVAADMAMEQHPFSGELIAAKAQVLANLERFKEAEDLLSEYRKSNPYDTDAVLNLASVYGMQRKFEQSLELLESALNFAEDLKDEIHFNLGLAYYGLDKIDLAIEQYKKAIEYNLGHDGALYELAYCLDQVGQLQNSLSYYRKFIDEDPFSAPAWYNLGTVYNKLEQHEEAVEAYGYAIAIEENFSSAHFNLGNAHLGLQQFQKALESFKTVIDLEGPGPEIYCSLAYAYDGLLQPDLALKYFQKATKLNSLYDEAWFGAGLCLEKQGHWHQALHFYNKAVKLDFNNSEYWKAVARMDFRIGNIVSSVAAFEEAVNLDPMDRDIWLEWSAVYHDQGNFEKAAEVLKEGLLDLTDDHELYYRAAANLILAGKLHEAFTFLENALLLNFEAHTLLLDYFPQTDMRMNLIRLISQFNKNSNDDGQKPSKKS